MLRCFCVFAGLGWVFFNTGWGTFCVLAGMGSVWWTQVEMYFVFSISWDRFGYTRSDVFCSLAVMGWFMYTQVEINHVFLRCKGGVWSTQVEIHFMSSLSWDVLGQLKVRYILCPRWYERDLLNTSWIAFSVISLIGGILVNTCLGTFSVLPGMG